MYGSTTTTPSSAQSRRLLDDSLAVQNETSNMADDVMARLFGQRETLESAQQRLGDMRGMTDEARVHLKEMEQKALRQKICLYLTIALLSILICLVIYREVTNSGHLF
ncbi:unnamed protein product [Ectocarpus sp. 8 AP-2014]